MPLQILAAFFVVVEGESSLHDPIGPPLLIPWPVTTTTQRAGLFTVDLSDAAPQPREGSGGGDSLLSPTDSEPEIPPVAFLFRIEERSSHNISYIWTVRTCSHTCNIMYSCRLSVCLTLD